MSGEYLAYRPGQAGRRTDVRRARHRGLSAVPGGGRGGRGGGRTDRFGRRDTRGQGDGERADEGVAGPDGVDRLDPERLYGDRGALQAGTWGQGGAVRARPPLIEAQGWSVQTSDPGASQYQRDDRVFHQKFGYGRVRTVEGNKLTVEFDKAGEKRVIDQFVSRA